MLKFLKKNKMTALLIGINALLLSGTVMATIAWFSPTMEIKPPTSEPTSGILTSYFDSGTGAENDPYIITRPIHFYHLSYLQNSNYFNNEEVYFQFGKNLDGTSEYKFYNYDNDGKLGEGYTHSLNMNYYSGTKALVPIGTSQHPFKSHISGMNNTIDNVNINGNGFSDIGIFGYVTSTASIHDVYFDHVTIDTGMPISTDAYHAHTDSKYNVGYIAGHIASEESFVGVYVNNTEAKNSVVPNVVGKSHYGYFGLCDSASTPLTTSSYDKYHIDPAKVRNYFNNDSKYENIKNKGLATRNTEYKVNSTTFSSAVSKNNSGASYSIKGTSSGAAHDYSLSTIGHQGMDMTYDLSYGNGHQSPAITTTVLAEGVNINTVETPGSYMYWNTSTSKWEYYVVTAGGSTTEKTYNVFSISYLVGQTRYYVYYDATNTRLSSSTTVPTTANRDYWFSLKTDASSLGVTSLTTNDNTATYYLFIPNRDLYVYITNSNVLNFGSYSDVAALSGTGNTGMFTVTGADSTIEWIGRYQSANHTFAFQGSTSYLSIIRPVSGNAATTFQFNGTSARTEETIATAKKFEQITNVNQLKNGMRVGIASQYDSNRSGYYMLAAQNTNNRAAIATTTVSGSESLLNWVSGVAVLTLGREDTYASNVYTLYDPEYDNNTGGYLYAASSSKNYLRTHSSIDDNSKFLFTVNTSTYAATAVAQGTNSHNSMRYNTQSGGTPLFSCYESGQTPIVLYKYVETGGTIYTANAATIVAQTESGADLERTRYDAWYDADLSAGTHDYQYISFERDRITWDFVNSQIIISPAGEKFWQKITSTTELESGDYLIVYEDGSLIFNGGLAALDANYNHVSVTITDDTIEYDSTTEAAKFTYNATTTSLKSASGYYIGATSDSNSLDTSTTIEYTNTITFTSDDVNILSSGGAYLRFNSASNAERFRYYKSSTYTAQKEIQLYKLVTESQDPEYVADAIQEADALYNYNVMDAVGDVSFSSTNITMSSNISNIKAVSKWHSDDNDDGIGAKFYSTKYLSNALVIFVPNRGTLDFGTLQLNCTSEADPAFIKGVDPNITNWQSSIGFSDSRIQCANDSASTNTYSYTLSLNKFNIFNLCYAALDSSGNIVASYNTNGNKVLPASSISLDSISTFVLAIGSVTTNKPINVSTIDLKVKQISGTMANYSYVGYRSATYTGGITDTGDGYVNNVSASSTIEREVIDYRFDSTNTNNRVYMKMVYNPSTNRYDITFKCSVTTHLYIFNFDAERVKLYVNNTQYKESYHDITVTGTNWS